jgi:hypothetical protein
VVSFFAKETAVYLIPKLGAALLAAPSWTTAALLARPNVTGPVAARTIGRTLPGVTVPLADAGGGDGPPPLQMDLTPDLAGLLGIPRQERSVAETPARLAPSAAERRVGVAILQLDDQEDQVLRWLDGPQTRQRLQAAGIKPEDMKARVVLMADALRKQMTAWILAPDTPFPELPVASRLYQDAYDACHAVQTAGRVDTIRRADTLRQLAAFEAAASSRLPQLAVGTAGKLIDFAAGNVHFRTIEDAALAFPCASSLRHTGNGTTTAVYPAGNIGGTPLRQARVGGLLLVAHGEGANEVKTSRSGLEWTVAAAYTDAEVLRAQLEMWARLRQSARQLAVRRQAGIWLHW